MTKHADDTAKIAEIAYHIWLEEGQPEGRDQYHWFAAVERLALVPAQSQPQAKAATKPRKPRATKAKAAAPKVKEADAKAPAKRSRKAAAKA